MLGISSCSKGEASERNSNFSPLAGLLPLTLPPVAAPAARATPRARSPDRQPLPSACSPTPRWIRPLSLDCCCGAFREGRRLTSGSEARPQLLQLLAHAPQLCQVPPTTTFFKKVAVGSSLRMEPDPIVHLPGAMEHPAPPVPAPESFSRCKPRLSRSPCPSAAAPKPPPPTSAPPQPGPADPTSQSPDLPPQSSCGIIPAHNTNSKPVNPSLY
uniref:Uncharacterized protein n=1 Tax=Kalanchoe fedtschenkoi TaxID=63787 RepID=A0A7N0ULR0_KALFE